MTLSININVGQAVSGGSVIGIMTSAGNPWNVPNELAQELVNRGVATGVSWPPVVPGDMTQAELAALRATGAAAGSPSAAQVAAVVSQQHLRRKRLAIIGDSITAGVGNTNPTHCNNAGILDSLVPANGNPTGDLFVAYPCIVFIGAERNCPAGSGTMTYTFATNSVTWTPNGGTAGAAQVLDRNRITKLEGGSAGQGAWVHLRPRIGTVNKLPPDDRTGAVNVGASGNGYQPRVVAEPQSYADWLKGALGLRFQIIGKWATSGNWTQNIVDQLPEIVAAKPDEAVVMIGTNNAGGGEALATTVADLATIANTLSGAGIFVRFLSLLPRADLATTAVIAKDAINSWLLAFVAGKERMTFHDVCGVAPNALRLPGVYTTASPFDVVLAMFRSTETYLHPNHAGAMAISATLAAQIKDAGDPVRYESPYDLYNGTSNPYGNLVTNPQMIVGSSRAGTAAGTINNGSGGGNLTGTSPDDWSAWCNTNSTAAAASSIVSRVSVDATDLTPGNWWKSIHSAAGSIQRYISLTLANLVAGDLVEFWCDFAVDNPSLFTALRFELAFGGADVISFGAQAGDTVGAGTTFLRKTVASPIFKVPASWYWTGQPASNPGSFRFNCFANSASGTLYLGNVSVRKIAPI